jgi:hypothetical protein
MSDTSLVAKKTECMSSHLLSLCLYTLRAFLYDNYTIVSITIVFITIVFITIVFITIVFITIVSQICSTVLVVCGRGKDKQLLGYFLISLCIEQNKHEQIGFSIYLGSISSANNSLPLLQDAI